MSISLQDPASPGAVGRTNGIDLIVDKDSTVIALDNGSVLEMPGFSLEFRGTKTTH